MGLSKGLPQIPRVCILMLLIKTDSLYMVPNLEFNDSYAVDETLFVHPTIA